MDKDAYRYYDHHRTSGLFKKVRPARPQLISSVETTAVCECRKLARTRAVAIAALARRRPLAAFFNRLEIKVEKVFFLEPIYGKR